MITPNIKYDILYLPDGKKIKFGVDTLFQMGVKSGDNTRWDQFIFKAYEEASSKIEYLKIKPDDVFIDIGAAIGSWSIYAAIYDARVYAFDFHETKLIVLGMNAQINNVYDRIKMYKAAIVKDVNQPYVDDDNKPVNCITLDNWVQSSGLSRIDYIKIDVEGMEYDVLLGGLETLKQFKPKLIIEIHDENNPQFRVTVENLLAELGYNHEHIHGLNDYFYPKTGPL